MPVTEGSMTEDFYLKLLQEYVDQGGGERTGIWWDESRIPLSSIDKSVSQLLDLTGKKAVVTGGAGANLGQACVNRLAGLGADVAVVDLKPAVAAASGQQRWATPPDAHGVAAKAAKRWGTNVIGVEGNALEWDGIDAILRECNDRLGGFDILVNNATMTSVGDFASMSHDQLDNAIRGTLAGPIYATRLALEYMLPQGSGRIINICSAAGETAMPGLTMYGAMKQGLSTFTRFLGKEVGRAGVHVNGVAPGSMWGPDRTPPVDGISGLYPRSRTAIQRYELPEEVANMVAFLASDAASAMTGVMVDMSGGQTI